MLDSVSVAKKVAEQKVKKLTTELAEGKDACTNLAKSKRTVEYELDESKKQHDFDDVERIVNLEKLKNELPAEVVRHYFASRICTYCCHRRSCLIYLLTKTKARATAEKQKRKLDTISIV